jgi:hypothetical protein
VRGRLRDGREEVLCCTAKFLEKCIGLHLFSPGTSCFFEMINISSFASFGIHAQLLEGFYLPLY